MDVAARFSAVDNGVPVGSQVFPGQVVSMDISMVMIRYTNCGALSTNISNNSKSIEYIYISNNHTNCSALSTR